MFGRCVLASIFFVVSFANAAQHVRVVTDGAIVYRNANFDAKVIGYFRAGQQVAISDKKFENIFYRVRFKQGVIGYIADVDVHVETPASDKSSSKGSDKKSEKDADQTNDQNTDKSEEKTNSDQKRKRPQRPKPMLAKTYLGLMGGYTNYSEIINKTEYKDSIITYGGKFTFPFDASFFVDVNLAGTLGSPQFYKQLSSIEPKGYIFLLSGVLNYPIFDFENRRGVVYMGGGPLVVMSSYVIEVSNSKLDLTEVRMGGVFNLGIAFDLGKALFKLEPKFYIEKSSYNSYDISVQMPLN